MTTTSAPPGELAGVAVDDASLRRFLRTLPGVDAVGLEARAATLAERVVSGGARLAAIDTAIRLVDLTSLEGTDTEATVRALCVSARRPDPDRPEVPPVAAVCVYPDRVATAAKLLAGSGVAVAAVATAFPSGRTAPQVKLAEATFAVSSGADEIDMVIDRAAFLGGRYAQVFDEIVAVRESCPGVTLKVILETGELGCYDAVRRACWLAMLAGADFLKTSTGKIAPAATLPVVHLLLQAVRDFHRLTGRRCGVKPAGGIRTSVDAIRYLVAAREIAGGAWLSPRLFRLGASGLLRDLLAERRALAAEPGVG